MTNEMCSHHEDLEHTNQDWILHCSCIIPSGCSQLVLTVTRSMFVDLIFGIEVMHICEDWGAGISCLPSVPASGNVCLCYLIV